MSSAEQPIASRCSTVRSAACITVETWSTNQPRFARDRPGGRLGAHASTLPWSDSERERDSTWGQPGGVLLGSYGARRDLRGGENAA